MALTGFPQELSAPPFLLNKGCLSLLRIRTGVLEGSAAANLAIESLPLNVLLRDKRVLVVPFLHHLSTAGMKKQ